MFLNCKTFFSFQYGTYSTKQLVEAAEALGLSQLALTNINCTADIWDFVKYCREKNIKAIAGSEIRNDNQFWYLLLAQNERGLMHINRFLSAHLQTGTPFPLRPDLPEDVHIIYALGQNNPITLLPHEWIGIKPTELNKLFRLDKELIDKKFVIMYPVSFQNKRNFNLHRLLRAIAGNKLLSQLRPDETASEDEMFIPPQELLAKYENYPALIQHTGLLMESCNMDINLSTDKNKRSFLDTPELDRELLKEEALKGLIERYGSNNDAARERVYKELAVINELNYNAYFLIAWDIVNFALRKGFFYVGRGSGANSIVAYCLRITDVDPITLNLYFERFMNLHRQSPPDFDMDFSWQDRDQITEYVFNRHGDQYVALLGMHSTFQRKASIRELGKVFGLPKEEIDLLVSNKLSGFGEHSIQRLLLRYVELMNNFPNHLSIHPGGILISERPLHSYTAIELPPKGFRTAQIDMFGAEKVGLMKFDVLSQRGLGHIKDAVEIIKDNQNVDIDIHKVEQFMNDPNVADKIRKADTIGCFYIESPAMRQLLLKLRCDNYLSLVAASSIIRPGVAQSGMMRQYIQRFHNPDSIQYLHPKMKELLEETYGVMVYQEDVIRVAHYFAGIEMADADVLRRAMSGKYRGTEEMDKIRNQFFNNCTERDYAPDVTAEVWRQMESFSGYSFSKAHSASYAVESYQSLYLKTYYPKEFMVAVINNFGGFYRTELYFHELKRVGAQVYPPCANNSKYLTDIKGNEVYMGFIHIQDFEKKLATALITEREQRGPYKSLEDFIDRLQPGIEQLNLLIRIGALRFTGHDKKTLLWKANFFKRKKTVVDTMLFQEPAQEFALPAFATHALEDAFDEMEILGFTLTPPFKMVNDSLEGYCLSRQLPEKLGQEVSILGYLITIKEIRTIKKDYMNFGTFLDQEGDWLDTVHFPNSIRNYPFAGNGFYCMQGKVIEEFGVYSVDVAHMRKVGLIQQN